MSLADRLNEAQRHVADARRTRTAHPKGFEPGIKYVASEPTEVTLTVSAIPENEQAWRDEIKRTTGMDIPENRCVELTGVRYWGDPAQPYIYCRFSITDRRNGGDSDVDAVALLRDLRKGRGRKTTTHVPMVGESTFVLSWNDLQVGKLEGGGTPALIERWESSLTATIERVKELRRLKVELGHLVIIGGGDIIENCVTFPNQAHEIDCDRRTQIRTAVTLFLEGIDRLAPLFEKVTVLAVGGNHGENRVNGKRTTRGDNDDCAVFEHVATATARDPKLNHVNFVIAQDEMSKTLEVSGWVLGTTHGHVFGKNGSGSIEQKALKWFMSQAAGRQPIGDADVFVTHHFHHVQMRDWGSTVWIQSPAMDGGSLWLTDLNGMSSGPGVLSFVMSPDNKFHHMQVLA